jgi:hypothetical protein
LWGIRRRLRNVMRPRKMRRPGGRRRLLGRRLGRWRAKAARCWRYSAAAIAA